LCFLPPEKTRMLEHIREKAPRWLVSTILVLLVVPFALWGIGSYVQPDTTRVVAHVSDCAPAWAMPIRRSCWTTPARATPCCSG
jgi:hypothetical protein